MRWLRTPSVVTAFSCRSLSVVRDTLLSRTNATRSPSGENVAKLCLPPALSGVSVLVPRSYT